MKMMKQIRHVVFICVSMGIAQMLGGCGTFFRHMAYGENVDMRFLSTKVDVAFIKGHDPYTGSHDGSYATVPFGILDFPFSLVVDLLTYPFDLYHVKKSSADGPPP